MRQTHPVRHLHKQRQSKECLCDCEDSLTSRNFHLVCQVRTLGRKVFNFSSSLETKHGFISSVLRSYRLYYLVCYLANIPLKANSRLFFILIELAVHKLVFPSALLCLPTLSLRLFARKLNLAANYRCPVWRVLLNFSVGRHCSNAATTSSTSFRVNLTVGIAKVDVLYKVL